MAPKLVGARVVNVYSMGDGSYTLKLRTASSVFELRFVPESIVFLIEGTYEEHPHPDEFASSLRSQLKGRTLTDLRAVEGERVIEFVFDWGGRLVIQLFPGGRTLLLSKSGEVLLARPALGPSESVPVYSPRRFAPEDLLDGLRSLPKDQKLGQAMVKSLNVPPKYVNEALYRAKVNGSVRVRELSASDLERLSGALVELFKEIASAKPVVYRSAEGVEISLVRLTHLEARGYSVEEFDSVNEALSKYFSEHLAVQRAVVESKRQEERLRRIEEEIREKEQALRSVENEANELRSLAELVFAHMHDLESIKVSQVRIAEIGDLSVSLEGAALVVKRGSASFVMSVREPVSKQISRIYERVKGLEEGARNLRKEVEELRARIEEVKRAGFELSRPVEPSVRRARPKEWYEAYRWTFTSSGRLVVAGRDANSNVRLLKRNLEADDLVFHAEVRGSPVALLKGGGDESDVLEAATFCACYSRAWKEKLSRITVYHVKPYQVSFSPPQGTYLPRGSFIVNPPKNYLQVKLELTVGITKDGRAVSGCREWVKSVAAVYAVLVPGDSKAAEVAAEMVRLAEESGLKLERTFTSELASLIPYGVCEVLEVKSGVLRNESTSAHDGSN